MKCCCESYCRTGKRRFLLLHSGVSVSTTPIINNTTVYPLLTLSHDRLAYLLIIDVSSFRPSWQSLLVTRIVGKLSADYKNRIVFQTPDSAHHAVHIMQLGHVLLDPFPITGRFCCSCLFSYLC